MPDAGDQVNAAEDDKVAKQVVEHRRQQFRKRELASTGRVSLENLMERISEGIDQKELAQRTGFTEKHISQIVQGKAPISADAAIRLERVTGVPAHFWNNLEAQYQERKARLEAKEKLASDLDWLGTIPVKELIRRGAIRD